MLQRRRLPPDAAKRCKAPCASWTRAIRCKADIRLAAESCKRQQKPQTTPWLGHGELVALTAVVLPLANQMESLRRMEAYSLIAISGGYEDSDVARGMSGALGAPERIKILSRTSAGGRYGGSACG
jgi:hypothetical protein